jgi:hypothetical protein
MNGNAANAVFDRTLVMAPREWGSSGRKAWLNAVRAVEADGEVLIQGGTIAQVVVKAQPRIVDQDIERLDLANSRLYATTHPRLPRSAKSQRVGRLVPWRPA